MYFDKLRTLSQHIISTPSFEKAIIWLILLNGIVLGLETVESFSSNYRGFIEFFNKLVLTIFILEAFLKIIAVWPKISKYFRSGWNLFDFFIIIISLIPNIGSFATIARMGRLLRALRLVSVKPELRLIVDTLIRSIPSMGNVISLLCIFFYIYGVTGYHLFNKHDPLHWDNLGISMLTLFRILTLEDWTDVMYKAMESSQLSWIYFVSFVVLSTFIIINIFIAVIINNLEEAKLSKQKMDITLKKLEVVHGSDIRIECFLPAYINYKGNSILGALTSISPRSCKFILKEAISNKDRNLPKNENTDIDLSIQLPDTNSKISICGILQQFNKHELTDIVALEVSFKKLENTSFDLLNNFIISRINDIEMK